MTSEPGSERPSDGERGGGQAPVDPDVDLHIRSERIETRARRWDVLVAIAIGGVLGSEARHGISVALPHPADAMPWATFLINVSGCALIGVLMVTISELTSPHRLVRPLLGRTAYERRHETTWRINDPRRGRRVRRSGSLPPRFQPRAFWILHLVSLNRFMQVIAGTGLTSRCLIIRPRRRGCWGSPPAWPASWTRR